MLFLGVWDVVFFDVFSKDIIVIVFCWNISFSKMLIVVLVFGFE